MAYRGPQPPNLRISSSSSTPSRGTSAANPILSIINPLAPHTRPAQRSGFSQLRSATNPNSFDMDDTILPADDFGLLCLEIDSLDRFCSLHFLFSFVLILSDQVVRAAQAAPSPDTATRPPKLGNFWAARGPKRSPPPQLRRRRDKRKRWWSPRALSSVSLSKTRSAAPPYLSSVGSMLYSELTDSSGQHTLLFDFSITQNSWTYTVLCLAGRSSTLSCSL